MIAIRYAASAIRLNLCPLCALVANGASKNVESGADATRVQEDGGPNVRSKYDKNWDLNMQVSIIRTCLVPYRKFSLTVRAVMMMTADGVTVQEKGHGVPQRSARGGPEALLDLRSAGGCDIQAGEGWQVRWQGVQAGGITGGALMTYVTATTRREWHVHLFLFSSVLSLRW